MDNHTDNTNIPNEETQEVTETLPVPVHKNELIEVEVEQPELSPLQRMDEKANMVIAAATASAATTCALPIPFADAPILVAEQVGMMASLCAVYHIDMKKNALRSIVLGTFGVGGTTIIGKTVFTSLCKLIPGAGSLLGGTIAAATGGALTAALGKAWQIMCKDVVCGKLTPKDLTSKEGMKLLTTTMQDQLRLEMKKKEKAEPDVLVTNRRPSANDVIVTPYHPDEQVFITPYPGKSTLKPTHPHEEPKEAPIPTEEKSSGAAESAPIKESTEKTEE